MTFDNIETGQEEYLMAAMDDSSDTIKTDIPYPMGRAGRGVLPKGAPLPRIKLEVVDNELKVEFDDQGFDEDLSDQAARVVRIILGAMFLFVEKNQGYGNTAYNLGARGQYADMNRKFGKLKHILWDGNPAVGESIEEICSDFIGHCGLTIDFVNQEGIK